MNVINTGNNLKKIVNNLKTARNERVARSFTKSVSLSFRSDIEKDKINELYEKLRTKYHNLHQDSLSKYNEVYNEYAKILNDYETFKETVIKFIKGTYNIYSNNPEYNMLKNKIEYIGKLIKETLKSLELEINVYNVLSNLPLKLKKFVKINITIIFILIVI